VASDRVSKKKEIGADDIGRGERERGGGKKALPNPLLRCRPGGKKRGRRRKSCWICRANINLWEGGKGVASRSL